MNSVMEKIKNLVETRNQHQSELTKLQEKVSQETSTIVFLEGGIQSLIGTLTDEEKVELENYYKELSNSQR